MRGPDVHRPGPLGPRRTPRRHPRHSGDVELDDGASAECRRRGLELQSRLPQPTGLARWWGRKRRSSEGAEIAEGTVDLALAGAGRGLLLVVPALLIWVIRRLRKHSG